MSAAPPGLVRGVGSAVVNLKHLAEVLLRVEPGLLDGDLVNVGTHGLVLQVVRVDEVERDHHCEALDGASHGHSEPAWADLNGAPDGPQEHDASCEEEQHYGRSVRLHIIVTWVVLVDRENPGRVVNWHLIHASPI